MKKIRCGICNNRYDSDMFQCCPRCSADQGRKQAGPAQKNKPFKARPLLLLGIIALALVALPPLAGKLVQADLIRYSRVDPLPIRQAAAGESFELYAPGTVTLSNPRGLYHGDGAVVQKGWQLVCVDINATGHGGGKTWQSAYLLVGDRCYYNLQPYKLTPLALALPDLNAVDTQALRWDKAQNGQLVFLVPEGTHEGMVCVEEFSTRLTAAKLTAVVQVPVKFVWDGQKIIS